MNIALRNGIALCSLTADEIDTVCPFSYEQFLQVFNDAEQTLNKERLHTAKIFGNEICKFCVKVFQVENAANVNFMIRNFNEKRIIVSLSEAYDRDGEDLLSEMDDIENMTVDVLDHIDKEKSAPDELEMILEEVVKSISVEEKRMNELKKFYSKNMEESKISTPNIEAIERIALNVRNREAGIKDYAPVFRCFRFFDQDAFLAAMQDKERWIKNYSYIFTITKTRTGRNGVIYGRILFPSVKEADKAELLLAEYAEVTKGIHGEMFQIRNK